eukprot:scaffold1122_cov377-Prasinococcus_capsulatus_cf.AAC.8
MLATRLREYGATIRAGAPALGPAPWAAQPRLRASADWGAVPAAAGGDRSAATPSPTPSLAAHLVWGAVRAHVRRTAPDARTTEIGERQSSPRAVLPESSSRQGRAGRHRPAAARRHNQPRLDRHVLELLPHGGVDALRHGLDLRARTQLEQLALASADERLHGVLPPDGLAQLPLQHARDLRGGCERLGGDVGEDGDPRVLDRHRREHSLQVGARAGHQARVKGAADGQRLRLERAPGRCQLLDLVQR